MTVLSRQCSKNSIVGRSLGPDVPNMADKVCNIGAVLN